ncbi:MAG: alpha-L-arabinofuranosidase C-terminal domain-containing protein [Limisphaerales bacterium]
MPPSIHASSLRLAALLSPLLLAPLAAAPNLIPNPSFEQSTATAPSNWITRAWAGENQCTWHPHQPGHSGTNAVSITSDQGADAAWTTTVNITPHEYYKLSGWIKTDNVRGAVGALFNIQNMQGIRTPAITGTHDWTRVEVIFLADTPTLEINCLFGGWGSSTGQAWFDDVALKPADPDQIPKDDLQASVNILTEESTVAYSRMLFGGFLEHFEHQIYGGVFDPGSPLSNEQGFRLDVIQALAELDVPVVRWPGGCFVSGYHWEPGVGPNRQPVDDMAWGVIEPNTFGTDEFVALCRQAGWEPYICNNAGNGSIEEMQHWVEYCNTTQGRYAQLRQENGHASPHNVKLWSIGNENWGQHEIGYKPIEEWAPFVRQAAIAIKEADPTTQLSAAAIPTREWTQPLLEQAGPFLDYISIHGYWLPMWQSNDTPDYLSCIRHSQEPENTITSFIQILNETGYRGRIKIAFDEWNLRGWHHPGFPRKSVQDYNDPEVIQLIQARDKNAIHSQYTMADALFSASFLNACLRHAEDVGMANIAPIVNTRGPLFVHPNGVLRRTHFHTLSMYANHLQSRVAPLDIQSGLLRIGSQSIPVLDAIATVNPSGNQWSIALINRHPSKSITCSLQLGTTPLQGAYPAVTLTSDSPDAYNDPDHPNRVTPQTTRFQFTNNTTALPPHSLSILHLSRP